MIGNRSKSIWHVTRWLCVSAVAAYGLILSGTAADDPAAREKAQIFETRVKPILAENCFKCHSHTADKIKGGLVLDSFEALLKGGDTGPAIVPGDLEKSLLIKAV